MYYILYLVAMAILLFMGAVTKASMFPAFSLQINFANLINFLDIWGIVFLLVSILVILFFTKSLSPMKDAVLFVLGKRDAALVQYEECILAVKTTMISAMSSGMLMFLMSMVNVFKGIDMDGGSAHFGTQFATGLISLIYGGIVVLIVLPIYVHLKRNQAKQKQIPPVQSNKKKRT